MDIKKFIYIGVIILVLDMLYISRIKDKYNEMVTSIQGSEMKVNMYGAVFAYLMLTLGVYKLVELNLSLQDCFIMGFVVYGVYNGTCHGIFNNWNEKIAIMDTIWGGTLFLGSVYVVKKLKI